ncbi:hypothetical protein SPI_04834 [Niveomyces insectorum RCEF 264]|uniref:Uncharacterized protein n=1 Tax=Niveomyces insectorum RCEF 264 TaxID=1081102 RepID=A0A167UWG5_9HYPO|nr:hypothetical protein SPI_04834 [Niveomyces insectorum RCEF 264]
MPAAQPETSRPLGPPSDATQEQERLRLEANDQNPSSALASPPPYVPHQPDPAVQEASPGPHEPRPPESPWQDGLAVTDNETVASSALLGGQGKHPAASATEAGLPRRPKVIKYWMWEILGLVAATASIGATFGTLAHFDGLEVPKWPLGINLTTLVSLYVTVFTTGTTASVVSVMSQAKWAWFASPRPLADLASFDRASRGTVGSVLLLFAPLRRSALGTVASIVSLVSLVVAPFAQQAIRSVTCQYIHAGHTGTIPVANFVSYDVFWDQGRYQTGMDAAAAVVAAMINAVSGTGTDNAAIVPSCPTGNCTFSAYQGITHSSIGLCSACSDSSAEILGPVGSVADYQYNYTLPNGGELVVNPWEPVVMQFLTSDNLENETWVADTFPANLSRLLPAALLDTTVFLFSSASCGTNCSNGTILAEDMDQMFLPLAVSCVLYPCLKNYWGEVVNGEFNETLVSSVPALPEEGDPPYVNFTVVKSPCMVDGQVYDTSNFSLVPQSHQFGAVNYNGSNITAPYECLYEIGGNYVAALGDFFATSLFSGPCGMSHYEVTPQCQNFLMPAFWANGTATVESVAALMDRFATGMTTNFRRVGSRLDGGDAAVRGMALTTTVCTRVEWGWLALPTVVLFLSLGLQCWAIWMSYADRRLPVWKSSLLPLLYHGFVEPVDKTPGRALDEDELETRAEKIKVRFRRDSGAVGFEARW